MIKSLEFCSSETALQLSNLEQNLFSMSWDASIIEQKINDKSFKYWIYQNEDKIIGYLGIQFIHHDIEILGIGVLEEYRKKGVATELMDLLISYFETSKYEKIILEVRESNTSAQSLYKKYNFKYFGKRKKYYVTEDADIFIKEKVYAE